MKKLKAESPRLGKLLKDDPAAAERLRAELKELGDKAKAGDVEITRLDAEIEAQLLVIPNIPHASVPDGEGAGQNVVVRFGARPKPEFAFPPKEHWELGEALGLLDFERGTKVSGTRFTFLLGAAAQLSRALAAFMLNTHVAKGYTEVLPPFLVTRESMKGTVTSAQKPSAPALVRGSFSRHCAGTINALCT